MTPTTRRAEILPPASVSHGAPPFKTSTSGTSSVKPARPCCVGDLLLHTTGEVSVSFEPSFQRTPASVSTQTGISQPETWELCLSCCAILRASHLLLSVTRRCTRSYPRYQELGTLSSRTSRCRTQSRGRLGFSARSLRTWPSKYVTSATVFSRTGRQ